jgi:hypothetical protein
MSALCIAAGGAAARLAVTAFTLGWVHSIERTPIEDAWVMEGDRLRLIESRIKGSGAGIEPGEGARVEKGWIVWSPAAAPVPEIVLRRSGVPGTGDWTICTADACSPLGKFVPPDADPVVLRVCE